MTVHDHLREQEEAVYEYLKAERKGRDVAPLAGLSLSAYKAARALLAIQGRIVLTIGGRWRPTEGYETRRRRDPR